MAASNKSQSKATGTGWTLKRVDSRVSSGTFRTQSEALKAARRIAKTERTNVIILETRSSQFDPTVAESTGSRVCISAGTSAKLKSAISSKEKARLWRQWAESHSRKTPLLSDAAISRESIYGDRD